MDHLVFQYLHEQGLWKTLEAFEAETKLTTADPSLPNNDRSLAQIVSEWTSTQQANAEMSTEMESLTLTTHKPVPDISPPSKCVRVFDQIHYGNVLAVHSVSCPPAKDPRFPQTSTIIVSSGADKLLQFTDYDTAENLITMEMGVEGAMHDRPILAIDADPLHWDRLATCSMDGSIAYFQLDQHRVNVLQVERNHSKYAVNVKFSPDGKYLISSSYDRSINIYARPESHGIFQLLHKIPLAGPVEAMTVNYDSRAVIIGCRNDNYLRFVSLATGTVEQKINLNENGDDHVSFTPMAISLTPPGFYAIKRSAYRSILVSTDKESGRLVMLKPPSEFVGNMYGPHIDGFSSPKHEWHPSGKFVFVTSDEDYAVWIYDFTKSDWILKLSNSEDERDKLPITGSGHTAIVRALFFDKSRNALITCGFDKTIIVWE